MSKSTRVEKHVIKSSNPFFEMLDRFCFLSKNLYNHANFIIRNEMISNGRWIRYEDLDKLLKQDNEFPDYRLMPCSVAAQQTLRSIDAVWKAYFRATEDYEKHPDKYLGAPKFPKYKDKHKGRHPIYLTNQACVLKDDGTISFPRCFKGFKVVPKFIHDSNFVKFNQCRIVHKGNHVVIELVYEIKVNDLKKDNQRYLGVDLGLDNLAAISNNVGLPFYLIDGKGLKSMNRHWNKSVSIAKSKLMKGGSSYTSNRIQKMTYKRNRRVDDYLHKASRWIVDFADRNNINTIVVGKNKNWKQKSNLGARNNQKFVQIPHARFIEMIIYKAEEFGIAVKCVEESYTSKTSFIDSEDPIKLSAYQGTRKYRGLFQTRQGYLINADSNGALQIIKKHVDYPVFGNELLLMQRPTRINVS